VAISDGNHETNLPVMPCLSTWPKMDTQDSVGLSIMKQLGDGGDKVGSCNGRLVCLVCMELLVTSRTDKPYKTIQRLFLCNILQRYQNTAKHGARGSLTIIGIVSCKIKFQNKLN
jgi:hypothetical protein